MQCLFTWFSIYVHFQRTTWWKAPPCVITYYSHNHMWKTYEWLHRKGCYSVKVCFQVLNEHCCSVHSSLPIIGLINDKTVTASQLFMEPTRSVKPSLCFRLDTRGMSEWAGEKMWKCVCEIDILFCFVFLLPSRWFGYEAHRSVGSDI